MGFSCFQLHSGSCDDVPIDFHVQQNGHCKLHSVDRSFEPATGSIVPFATFYHESYPQGITKKDVADGASSIIHNPGPHLPLLSPKPEISHLIGGGMGSYKTYDMSGRFIPRRKASSKAVKKANVVKGQWTPEEDRKLVKLVEQFGLRKWSQMAQMLPARVGKQCRERWHNHLRPNIKKDTWSEEEDMVLIQTHKEVGNKWAEIAKRLPGRTENSIKNHWNATKRKQSARRRARRNFPTVSPPTNTLLQNYIKSLGIACSKGIAPQDPKESPLSASSPAPPTQNRAHMNDNWPESNPSNIMEVQYQAYNIDDDVDMDYIINHIDYAIKIDNHIDYAIKIDHEIDMNMTWDDDALVNIESG
ncbi:hypothetical protein VPH35_004511 [Triticum aestivum]